MLVGGRSFVKGVSAVAVVCGAWMFALLPAAAQDPGDNTPSLDEAIERLGTSPCALVSATELGDTLAEASVNAGLEEELLLPHGPTVDLEVASSSATACEWFSDPDIWFVSMSWQPADPTFISTIFNGLDPLDGIGREAVLERDTQGAFVVDNILVSVTNLPPGHSGTVRDRPVTIALMTALAAEMERRFDAAGGAPEIPPTVPIPEPSPPAPSPSPSPDDTPRCDGKVATIVGTDGNDVITGTAGNDVIVGLGGRDKIRGLGGRDVICGGAGNDVLIGGGGKDRLFGESGRDRLRGGGGPDRLDGGARPDKIDGGPGRDVCTTDARDREVTRC